MDMMTQRPIFSHKMSKVGQCKIRSQPYLPAGSVDEVHVLYGWSGLMVTMLLVWQNYLEFFQVLSCCNVY